MLLTGHDLSLSKETKAAVAVPIFRFFARVSATICEKMFKNVQKMASSSSQKNFPAEQCGATRFVPTFILAKVYPRWHPPCTSQNVALDNHLLSQVVHTLIHTKSVAASRGGLAPVQRGVDGTSCANQVKDCSSINCATCPRFAAHPATRSQTHRRAEDRPRAFMLN